MSWGTSISVASESFQATYLGLKIHEMGGGAGDVAVAVSLALSYLLPHLNGVGGDFLALYEKGGSVKAVLGLGWAPGGISGRPPESGLRSAVVPGFGRGLWELHRALGSMEWSKLVGYVVDFLERRAVVHPSLAEALSRSRLEGPGAALYASIPREPGAPYRVEPLLALYRIYGEHGPDGLYEALADSLSGGYFSRDDILQYRAEVRDPVSMEYRGWTLYEAPPPSLGFSVLLTLKLAGEGLPREPFSYGRIRAVVRAARKAHWARDRYLGDGPVPVEDLLLGRVELGESESPMPTGDTTYFAVADREVVISAIQSIYYSFGSRYVEGRWGVVLNNRAFDFTQGPNAPAPRKRPAHTLSAVIAVRGDLTAALGSSAGHYRPVIYAQMVQNLVDYSMDIRRVVWAPRFIWVGGWKAEAERGYEAGPDVDLVEYPSRLGVAALAYRRGGSLAAVADIRGDGAAASV
ncbi:gamma-glutamyltransferase [Thermoproteus sp. CP80]|jgi:gamma-glutamyltranspeptidase/glutathione hydrolase|uniref:gamma-glutamyltransferase n=1 Tax=Thermoproteus sp. CP80 TaxID=1650659 RepID=UPI0009BE3EC7|nr:gamma-glutamyltransferase [Thermoproteus sp. CP80]PLC67263.1 gamma-glutamyltransferase [Thermoproteus sp. CP80]